MTQRTGLHADSPNGDVRVNRFDSGPFDTEAYKAEIVQPKSWAPQITALAMLAVAVGAVLILR